jgi:hypothetical protein
MLPTKRVSGKVVALALAVFAASCCFSFAASEYEYAVLDDVPSPAPPRAAQNIPPPPSVVLDYRPEHRAQG